MTKLKFPCCVETSDIKDENTFDNILAAYVANGAEVYDKLYRSASCWEYFGVSTYQGNSTQWYDNVKSYSSDANTESEVTIYTVEEVLASLESLQESPIAGEDNPYIDWSGGISPVAIGTKVDVRYRDGNEAIGIGSQDGSYVDGCTYSATSWNNHGGGHADIVAYRLHKPSKVTQNTLGDVLTPEPSVSIGEAKNELQSTTDIVESTVTLVEIKPIYHVTIKGCDFTFTQDELNEVYTTLGRFGDYDFN